MQMKNPIPSRSRRLTGMALAMAMLGASTLTAWASQPNAVKDAGAETDQEPTYRALKPPVYPRAAFEAGQEGKVVLRVLVGSDGKPQDITVDRASNPGVFDAAAITAVNGWTFNPATRDGAAVDAWVLVPVCFATVEQAECEATSNALDGISIRPPQASAGS